MWFVLKPAPFQNPLQLSKEEQEERYRYWRYRIFYSMYGGYAIYYFTRKSFTFAMPMMADDLGLSMAQLGIFGSILYITYGISKFLSGVVSDKSNPRYFMAIGLIMTGIINIAFGSSSSLWLLACLWGLNGFFQGWGWPPCTKLLTYWFAKRERGFWWSLKSTSHNVGGALIPILAAVVSSYYGWRYSMYVPGIIAIITGLWLMERLRDIPQSLGFPEIEAFKATAEYPAPEVLHEKQLTVKEILFDHVMCNRAVWILSISYFFVYIIRAGFNDWGAMFLVKGKGYSDLVLASASVTWFEVGGFLGTLAAGWASDKFFMGRRLSYMIYSALLLIPSIWCLWKIPAGHIFLDSLIMGVIGFLIFGPQLLVGLAAAEYVDKKAAGTANGFAGSFAYAGAAATGYPLGKIIDYWGWNGLFITMVVCTIAMFLVILPLWIRKELDYKAAVPDSFQPLEFNGNFDGAKKT